MMIDMSKPEFILQEDGTTIMIQDGDMVFLPEQDK